MGMLDLLEKLITEHGSSAVLRERLQALKDEAAKLTQDNATLKTECDRLASELKTANARITALQGVTAQVACDHCGSTDLERIGNRPDKIFGALGGKLAVLKCNRCQKETTYALPPPD